MDTVVPDSQDHLWGKNEGWWRDDVDFDPAGTWQAHWTFSASLVILSGSLTQAQDQFNLAGKTWVSGRYIFLPVSDAQ